MPEGHTLSRPPPKNTPADPSCFTDPPIYCRRVPAVQTGQLLSSSKPIVWIMPQLQPLLVCVVTLWARVCFGPGPPQLKTSKI